MTVTPTIVDGKVILERVEAEAEAEAPHVEQDAVEALEQEAEKLAADVEHVAEQDAAPAAAV